MKDIIFRYYFDYSLPLRDEEFSYEDICHISFLTIVTSDGPQPGVEVTLKNGESKIFPLPYKTDKIFSVVDEGGSRVTFDVR